MNGRPGCFCKVPLEKNYKIHRGLDDLEQAGVLRKWRGSRTIDAGTRAPPPQLGEGWTQSAALAIREIQVIAPDAPVDRIDARLAIIEDFERNLVGLHPSFSRMAFSMRPT